MISGSGIEGNVVSPVRRPWTTRHNLSAALWYKGSVSKIMVVMVVVVVVVLRPFHEAMKRSCRA